LNGGIPGVLFWLWFGILKILDKSTPWNGYEIIAGMTPDNATMDILWKAETRIMISC
jgi:hypothetical protein